MYMFNIYYIHIEYGQYLSQVFFLQLDYIEVYMYILFRLLFFGIKDRS